MQDQLEQKLKDHIIYDKEKFGGIASDIKDIKGNHLFHIEKDINTLQTDVSILKTDTSWIKKIQWFLITSSIGILITLLTGLIVIVVKK